MTLTPDSKAELRNRLQFYRELGVGPLYRRAVERPAESSSIELMDSANIIVEDDVMANSLAASSGDRESLLRVILDDIGPNCTRCKLSRLGRKQIVFGTGDPHAELMFIGEGPGADEDEQGLPFVGRAGQLLNRMIQTIDMKRQEVYICNVVKCRPPGNRTPEKDEIETCSPFLFRQIETIQPRLICCLGAPAVRTVLGIKEGITRIHGQFYDFAHCKALATVHPAYVLRNPREEKILREDFEKIREFLKRK